MSTTNKAQAITIDGKQYAIADLSSAAKEHLLRVQATDAEIAQLKQRLLITQTARQVFSAALKQSLST